MVVRADINGTRSVTAIEASRPTASIADAGQEVLTRLNQIGIGKIMQAQVMSRMNDGSFMVKLADTAVRMNLPAGTQAGDALDLTLIATQPRLTFSMGGPTREPPATSLSNTGRLIDTVLRMAQKEGAPTTLVGKAPMVSSPAATPTQLATALKDTLTYSGLFYESHVQQWASGERSLTELMREPQARHGSAAQPALLPNADARIATSAAKGPVNAADVSNADGLDTNIPQAAKPDAKGAAQAHQGPSLMQAIRTIFSPAIPTQTAAQASSHAQPAPNDAASNSASPTATAGAEGSTSVKQSTPSVSTSADTQATTAKPTSDSMAADTGLQQPRTETINTESARMISLQLDTFEQRRVAWQGELWPGQPMEWEVTEDTPQGKPAASDAERSWQSAVRFELPILGSVAATIRLTGNRLQVQVHAASETTTALLREHGSELASALDAAGSPLDLLTVKQDESANIPGWKGQ